MINVVGLLGLTHKYCFVCGSRISTGQKYCESCSKKVTQAQRNASRKKTNGKPAKNKNNKKIF